MNTTSSTILLHPRQQLADPHARLAALLELVLRRRDREARLAAGHRREPLAHADRFGQVLVVPLLHHRLVVVQIHLRRPADHVQIDDMLRLGGEMRERMRPTARHRLLRRASQAGARQRRQRRRAQQVRPGRQKWRRVTCWRNSSKGFMAATCSVVGEHWYYRTRSIRLSYLFNTSSRFISSLATIVHAASCGAASLASALRFADGDQLLRVVGLRRCNASRTCSSDSRTIARSSGCSGRASKPLGEEVEPVIDIVARFYCQRCARWRAASTNCGSFSVTSACSGVFVRSRTIVQRLASRRVEDVHRRRRRGTLPERVHAAAIKRVARVLLVVARVAADHRDRFPHAGRLIRLHARPADLFGRAGRSRRAHNRAPFRHPCGTADRARAGDSRGSFSSFSGVIDRALPIRGRRDHQLEELLHVPARFAELDGQPIEQFGMRRQFARDAEVARRSHEPVPKTSSRSD